jgi:hypothetical protein
MNIRSAFRAIKKGFTEPSPDVSPPLRYAQLVLALFLLAFNVLWLWWASLPPAYPYERYGSAMVGLMLLFNLLAFQFRWPPVVTAMLRVLAFVWLVFGAFYIFVHLIHRMFFTL